MSDIVKGVIGTVLSTAVLAVLSLLFTPFACLLGPLFGGIPTVKELQIALAVAWVLIIVLAVFSIAVVFVFILLMYRQGRIERRIAELEGKPIAEPVVGENYLIDRRTGQPLCPKCHAEGKAAYLRYAVRTDTHKVVPTLFHCGVCGQNLSILQSDHFYTKQK